ncbi:MAG: phosphoribosyl-AMP cyclohydrolase [Candidatus Thorarchaeota archaeon]
MKKFSQEEIGAFINLLDFSKIEGELIPIIVQDYETNEVLMLAFANKVAIEKSLETRYMHYYSRSRQRVWKKGEISGHFQEIEKIFVDCDKDSILMTVKQIGGACHEGYCSCFYRTFSEGTLKEIKKRIFNPKDVYGD